MSLVRSPRHVVHEIYGRQRRRPWIHPDTGQEEGWTVCGTYWKAAKGWRRTSEPVTCKHCARR